MVDDSSLNQLPDIAPSPSQLIKLAISAALNCQWQEALDINKQIIKDNPESVECLNRMAKAYSELGFYSEAKKIYQQVLTLDTYNTIAQKNLQKVSTFKKDGLKPNHQPTMTLSPSSFLEEPGFTKSVSLTKLAEPQRILTLSAGIMVSLSPKNRGVSVVDMNNQYLGALPDDTAHHILKLMKGGNKYQAFIKSLKANKVTILIREVYRSKKFKNQASFLDSSKPLSYSSDHLSLITNAAEDDDSGDETEEPVI